ncbi:hypothetical protein [Pontibacter saemangeumensis]
MKSAIPFLLVLLLFSCSKKSDDLELMIKRDSCMRNIAFNEQAFSSVIAYYEELRGPEELGDPRDSIIAADCDQIVSWRRNFMKERTIENLLLYSDSVEARYSKHSRDGGELPYSIKETKNQLRSSADSLKYYNLLYLTTVAEGMLLMHYKASLGTGYGYSFVIPSYLDREKYNTRDTVYLTVNADFSSSLGTGYAYTFVVPSPLEEEEYGTKDTVSSTVNTNGTYLSKIGLDFSKVTCKGAEDGVNLKPKVIRSGPHYILLYTPVKAGTYTVGGKVIISHEGNFDSSIRIENKFEVKNTALKTARKH